MGTNDISGNTNKSENRNREGNGSVTRKNEQILSMLVLEMDRSHYEES
jgi:hypothetical protein